VICDITISADGYSAGLNQTEERPFGDDGGDGWGDKLHAWFAENFRGEPGRGRPDDRRQSIHHGAQHVRPSAWRVGSAMERLVGRRSPFHAPVFVLTHHAREPQPIDGGTTYYFVTDGIESALAQARAAASDGDVAIQCGATTVNQYLAAGLVDELRLHIVPFTLGAGTRLFEGRPAAETRAGEVAASENGHARDLLRAVLSWRAVLQGDQLLGFGNHGSVPSR